MVKYIELGNGKSAMHVQNDYLTHMLNVGFIDNYNYFKNIFPYGPVSSDFRYGIGKRFNRIVAAMNKIHPLPWVIGPIVNLKWVASRRFISDMELMYPHTLGLPYKASVADLNAHLLDLASSGGKGANLTNVCRNLSRAGYFGQNAPEYFHSKHVLDMERRYVLTQSHLVI